MTDSEGPGAPGTRTARRYHRWLLVLPFVWQLALVPVVNDVRFAPAQVPFPMLWQMAGVVFSSIVIGIVFALDRRWGAAGDEPDTVPDGGQG
ncbi:MAG: DUF3311 domain-containing protein [Candidatus Dormiibacterota bacterium]